MKIIMAYIQPYKLEEVRDALEKAGAHGITACDVKGHGRQRGHTEFYRGAEYKVSFASKIKIEVVVPGAQVDKALAAKQAEMAKAAYERAVGQMQELADLIQKSSGEALSVLHTRFAEAMEEVKNLSTDTKA